MSGNNPVQSELVIEPTRGWVGLNWSELWRYRELFGFLVWRDIKVKYKQTLLGVAWAVLVPLLQMLVFTFIFGHIASLPSDGLPRPVFYYAGLLPWTYFASSVALSANSMINRADLLTKIYLPRVMVPASPCLANWVDFTIAFGILVIMMLLYGLVPPLTTLLLPLVMAISFVTAIGTGLGLAALNVKYRDIRHMVPIILQMWMYITVILPFSAVPENYGAWRYLYGLNPMAGVVEGFRWCLLHPNMGLETNLSRGVSQIHVGPPWQLLAVGMPVACLLLVGGLAYFRRMERQFADIV